MTATGGPSANSVPADQLRKARSASRCSRIDDFWSSASAVRTSEELLAKKTTAASAMAGRSPAVRSPPSRRPVPPARSSASPASTHEMASWARLKTIRSTGRRRIRSAASEAATWTTTTSVIPYERRSAKANGVEKVSSPTWPWTWIGNSSPIRTSPARTQNSASKGPRSPVPNAARAISTAMPAALTSRR